MKKTKVNSNRGITLVALIITIIVMLILVAVTVTVVVDSDIIGQAEQAGDAYKTAYAEELKGNITIGEKQYNSLTDYIDTIVKDTTTDTTPDVDLISFTIDGTEYQAESGMTWAEWVLDPTYNTGGFYNDYPEGNMPIYCSSSEYIVASSGSSEPCFSQSPIESGHAYYIYNAS